MNIFNQKTVAFLDFKGCNDIAIFVKAVTTLNCINVKSKDAWFKINDENGKPFESADDQRLESILLLAEKFKGMDTSKSPYSGRVMCFTQCTSSNVLHLTLYGIVFAIRLILNKYHNCVLPGSFRSDRLEGELIIFRQSARIMNTLALQMLKLFSKLGIEKVVSHSKEEC